jgi:hypothetical protein
MIGTNTQKLLRVALASDDAMNDVSNNFLNPAVKRLTLNQGTNLTTNNVALSAGWGTTATFALAAGSNDSRGSMTITSNGSGQAADPTVTITFQDGAWPSAPFASVTVNGGSQPSVPYTVTTTTTTMTITFQGTPVAAQTFTFTWKTEG